MHAILFDIGNVLVKYDHAATLAATAACFGATPEAMRKAFGNVSHAFGLGKLQPNQVCSLLNQHFGASVPLEQFVTAFCTGLTRDDDALAYAVDLQIDGELAVGAISNTNAVHVAWLDTHTPELNQFELVMMSNEVGMLKPDPEIFALALEILAAQPAQVLYVDDLAENVEAAQRLGMRAILHHDWAETRAHIEAWRAS